VRQIQLSPPPHALLRHTAELALVRTKATESLFNDSSNDFCNKICQKLPFNREKPSPGSLLEIASEILPRM
jgi:hypothetical protein